jgi:hypothetical protein
LYRFPPQFSKARVGNNLIVCGKQPLINWRPYPTCRAFITTAIRHFLGIMSNILQTAKRILLAGQK